MSGREPQTTLAMELPEIPEEHLSDEKLIRFGNRELGETDELTAREHLDTCADCRDRLEALHLDDSSGQTKIKDPMVGRTLGEYQVEAALARGGMGVVYRGVQPMIGKKVAIKVLIPESDDATINRLLEEARAVNAIRHPNIIDIFSFGSLPDGRHYFVMALLEGKSLEDLAAEKQKLTADQVMTVLEQSMSALGAAHGAGVIHRDLKPANLFVSTLTDGSWHVTVLDFGLAKRLGNSNKTSTNIVMGTPGFMAPEQIRGKAAVVQTDIYAMGVVAWVLLTGREPFRAESILDLMRAHLNEPLPSLTEHAPATPRGLVALVEKMLEKSPERRPPTAMAVLAELRRLRLGGTNPGAQSPLGRAPARKGGNLLPAGMPTAELADALEDTAARPAPKEKPRPIQRNAETVVSKAGDARGPGTAQLQALVRPSRAPVFLLAGLAIVVTLGGLWWVSQRDPGTGAVPPAPEPHAIDAGPEPVQLTAQPVVPVALEVIDAGAVAVADPAPLPVEPEEVVEPDAGAVGAPAPVKPPKVQRTKPPPPLDRGLALRRRLDALERRWVNDHSFNLELHEVRLNRELLVKNADDHTLDAIETATRRLEALTQ